MPSTTIVSRLRAVLLCVFALAPLHAAHTQTPPLDLHVTIGTDLSPGACGTAQSIDITAGEQVNFCYTITNNSDDDLGYHTLIDDIDGTLLQDYAQDVPPGQSFQYNDIRVITASQSPTSTWTASTALAAYDTTTDVADPDRIFADGFDGGSAAYAFEEISATGINLQLDDDGEANVDIGFDFDFYGVRSNIVRVGNNGGILFGVSAGELGYNNLVLPNSTLGPAILPFWDDFDSESGGVFAQTLGDAPNRRLIVEWKDRVHYDGAQNTDPATFEAILYEGSNTIAFQYADVDLDGTELDDGLSATIGLNQGTRADQFSQDTASVSAGTAIVFTPRAVTSYSDSDVVTINAGAPDIVVTPASLDATVAAGGSTSLPLSIGNDGDRDLEWNVLEAPGSFLPSTSRIAVHGSEPANGASTYAPRPRSSQLMPPNKDIAPAGASVPAFGVNLNILEGNTFVGLDAANPGITTPIASTQRTLVGGAFLDDDFSRFYTLDFDTGEFLSLSTSDGSEEVIGVATHVADEDWSGLALDRSTGVLYASSTMMSGGVSSTLYSIDPATGSATTIGPIANGGRVIEIASNAAGQLYGVDIAGDALIAIDGTGATVIGPLGFDAEFAEGLDFDAASGVLYFAAVHNESVFSQPAQMYTIDTATGHATLVGGISADPASAQISAFAVAVAGGACATPADVPWLSVAPASGTTAPGSSSEVTVGFDAAALSAGVHTANLCVGSNDPDQPSQSVPVSLTVQ
jgi:hypothetical protein